MNTAEHLSIKGMLSHGEYLLHIATTATVARQLLFILHISANYTSISLHRNRHTVERFVVFVTLFIARRFETQTNNTRAQDASFAVTFLFRFTSLLSEGDVTRLQNLSCSLPHSLAICTYEDRPRTFRLQGAFGRMFLFFLCIFLIFLFIAHLATC